VPSSFHNILVYGADIVSVAILLLVKPRNLKDKNHMYFGRSHLRKTFMSSTNEDFLIYIVLLVSSVAFISSLRKLPKKATKTFVPKALKLFAVPIESENQVRPVTLLPQWVILTKLEKKILINITESKDFYISVRFY
jgi:hypothetical protein